jgi:peptidoglycan hydrolase-like amidase
MMNGKSHLRQNYSGDLLCFPDLGTLVFINISDVEKYIAGVVMAEGGAGKNLEYFKTQAIIARTYMYKYFDKHSSDKYNVCDNTHCQAYSIRTAVEKPHLPKMSGFRVNLILKVLWIHTALGPEMLHGEKATL